MRSEVNTFLAVAIVNWNRSRELGQLLADLEQQTQPADEIIVVDNNSTDDSVVMIEQEYPRVRLIRLHKNTGLSFARNVAVKSARAELIVMLDNDIRLPDRRFLHRVRVSAARHTDCGIISFHVISRAPDGARTAADGLVQYADLVEMAENDEGPAPGRFYYDWFFWGGACVIRRTVFDIVGGLDDDFDYGGEEWDFAYRCHAAGVRLMHDSGLWLVHTVSPKMRSGTYFYLRLQGMVLAQARHMPWTDLMLFLSIQFSKSALDAIKEGAVGSFLAICFQIVRYWPQRVFGKRRPVGRDVMRRFYFLRLHQTDRFSDVEQASTSAIDFYRARARGKGPEPAESAALVDIQPDSA